MNILGIDIEVHLLSRMYIMKMAMLWDIFQNREPIYAMRTKQMVYWSKFGPHCRLSIYY